LHRGAFKLTAGFIIENGAGSGRLRRGTAEQAATVEWRSKTLRHSAELPARITQTGLQHRMESECEQRLL
jgi:hypothetical protein